MHRVSLCLSSMILSPLNGNVKLSPHETGDLRWSASVITAYLGFISGVFALVALVSAFVIRLRPSWARIAVRVAGSWVVANGLLMFGWADRRG
jgi:hypothetical protein